jgi:maleate isomerase
VVVSCTNLPTYDALPRLEAALGLPVVSANLASVWAALRSLDALPGDRPERLFNC